MARKLAGFLILLSTWFPFNVLALGVGNIELKSYLNQPLDARVPVLSARQADLSQLRINIASRADHLRAGIDYTAVMSQLRLKVERKAGQVYIHITTRKPFREPYLSVLIEVNWANGRLLREYTVLIDPPGTIRSKPAAVSTAPAAPARPAKPVAPSQPTDERYPRIPIDEGTAPKPAAAPSKTDSYGPTRKHDTLWKIATRARPDRQVSVEQMMIALQRKNPSAFIGNNINRLKAGYILKIPARDVITALSHRQARAEVRNQYRAWKQARGVKPAAPAPATAVAGKQPGGKLRVIAPRGGAVSGKGGSTAGKGTATGSAGGDLAKAREAARASEREKAVLASRLKDMETQLANMKKLARLRNDQLAALQAKLAELRNKTAGGKGTAAMPAEGKPAASKPAATEPALPVAMKPKPGPAEKKPVQPAAVKPVEPKPAPKKTYEYVPAKDAAPGSPINQNKVAGYKPVDLKTLPKAPVPAQPFTAAPSPAPAAASKPAASASLPDQAMKYFRENTLMASVIGGGVLLLLLLLVLLIIRRRSAAAGFQESILTEPAEPAAAAPVAEAEPEEKVEQAEQQAQPEVEQAASSYLSDFTVSGMDALDSDVSESDPLTEADVFLAYGRFQPAEAMIREAIAAEPTRNDLKMKLLEIHYQAKDGDAFERDADEFKEVLSTDMDEWRRVSEMGRELNPHSSLFSEEGESAEAEEDAFAFSEFDAPEPESSAASENLETELQDLSDESRKEEALEFDLGGIEEAPKEEEPSSDIEFDLHEVETSADEEPEESKDAIANELADELSEIADTMEAEPKQAEPEQAEDVSGLGDVEEAGELEADLDEVGTKLDLARAYIDMGDPDGARSILDEVLEEGNDEQKKEAETLMSQI
jgi:pilus assembly protein FimV